ncbi:(2,3-dihydroxybenzoyl)adenylate synthase [Nocardioides sp. Bht2]|uniref:(2,3-dihydroxybenzoyl)adenylate synthase n=1 Tax=Nocardioides sp. Bht2 TaxID=3392297 RepID=UPI0039B50CD5
MTRAALPTSTTWPEEFRRRYRDAGYWTDETLASFVSERVQRFAERPAVQGIDGTGSWQRWSYRELGAAAESAATWLRAHGVEPGDRVVLHLPNTVELIAVLCGSFTLGAVPVLGLPSHRELELAQFTRLADAAAVIGMPGGQQGVADAGELAELHSRVGARLRADGAVLPVFLDAAELPLGRPVGELSPVLSDAEQVGLLQLSGGTTGVPKLIPRTHADYLYSVRESATICELNSESVLLVALPAVHNFALSSPGILGAFQVGASVVLAPDPSPRTAFGLIARERITFASLVPPLAQAWVAAQRRRPADLTSLAVVQVGGAKLAPSVAEEIEPVLGVRLQQVFGMAEGLVNYTRFTDDEATRHTSQGRPISAADEILIVDADDQPVPPGAEGALLTRGPYTIRGYLRPTPEAEASFTTDGFYRTGDRVRQLPSGHLIVTGRDKDQINRAGEKIAVDEIEEAALVHPAIHDALAIGEADPYLGERICLLVVLVPGAAEPADLRDHLRSRGLAEFKLPDRVVCCATFPTTAVGKNSRRALRRFLAEQGVEPAAAPPVLSTTASEA